MKRPADCEAYAHTFRECSCYDVPEAEKAPKMEPPKSLLASDAMSELIRVREFGNKKYGSDTWHLGCPWSVHFHAAMRHMWRWWLGKNYDSESSCHHLAHAMCRIMFLLSYSLRRTPSDDRPV